MASSAHPKDEVPPGYKLTEVGVIPEDWGVKMLREILRHGYLGGNYPNQDTETSYPLIKMGNVGRGMFDVSKVEYIPEQVHPDPSHLLNDGDVLFNTRNTLDLVGKVAIWQADLPIAYYNSNLMRLDFDPEFIASNSYMNYALNSDRLISELRMLATGTTSVAAIYTRDLVRLAMIIPPLPEQRAIAEALSDVDDLLNTLEALIAKKRDIKQAAVQQLLTGKTRLPGFTGEWETKRLGDSARFFKGSGLSKVDLSPDGKRRCIHYGELFTVYGERITDVLHGTDRKGAFFCSVRNDVLMPTSDVTPNGLATASCIQLSDVILGGDVLVIRAPEELLNGEFLAYAIGMNHNQVMQLVTGTTVFHLYGRDMANFYFSTPSPKEQRAIAAVLSDMDSETAALEQRRDKTRAIKWGMMQELLTGRVRLIEAGG